MNNINSPFKVLNALYQGYRLCTAPVPTLISWGPGLLGKYHPLEIVKSDEDQGYFAPLKGAALAAGVYVGVNVLHKVWKVYEENNQTPLERLSKKKKSSLVDKAFQVASGVFKECIIQSPVKQALGAITPIVKEWPKNEQIGWLFDGLKTAINFSEKYLLWEKQDTVLSAMAYEWGVTSLRPVVDAAITACSFDLNFGGDTDIGPIPKEVYEQARIAAGFAPRMILESPMPKEVPPPKVEPVILPEVKNVEPEAPGVFERFIQSCKELFAKMMQALFGGEKQAAV